MSDKVSPFQSFVNWLFTSLDRDGDGKLTSTDASRILAAFDRDGDGKITLNDAKLAALQLLDRDGDGQISLDEMELGAKDLVDYIEMFINTTHKALAPFEGVIMFSFGAFVCFYGKNFTYTILFGQVFRVSAWPVIKQAATDLKSSYNDARLAMKRNPAVTNSLTTTLLTCVDPVQLTTVVKGVYTGLVACLATALSQGAARLGVGLNIGRVIGSTVNTSLRPIVRRVVVRAVDVAKDEVAVLQDEKKVERWVDTSVNAICTSVTVSATYYFERTMYVVANALTGAEIMTIQLAKLAESRGVQLNGTPLLTILMYTLAGSGLYSQLFTRHGGNLPGFARFVLFFPLVAEKWLGYSASAVRSQVLTA